jgi:protein involved in polysaccharide export with SLBB domain
VDCSDPLMAGSQQCAQQTQGREFNLPAGGQTVSPGALPSGQLPGNVSYRDNGTLTSQTANRNQTLRTVLPPEPLTEFQKFVGSSTGQVLPIFGADLFRNVPSTFAPLDMTPVPPDYVIGPGDELRIRVWGQVNFNADLRVDRSGEIYLPQVGDVHVAGLPFSGLDGQLRKSIGRVYRNFDLTANVGQIRAIQVYVAGQARRAGVYTVSSLSTLVDALFASGGPSVQGSMRHVQLKRGGEVITDFDLYELLVHGDKSKDVKLLSGDVIFIPAAGPSVAVTGSVRSPAIYELREGETIGNAVTNAGGPSTLASNARVSIQRIADHRDQQALEVAMDTAGLATPLAGGDILRVISVVPRFQKTVTLRGNTANPGHFAWHQASQRPDTGPGCALEPRLLVETSPAGIALSGVRTDTRLLNYAATFYAGGYPEKAVPAPTAPDSWAEWNESAVRGVSFGPGSDKSVRGESWRAAVHGRGTAATRLFQQLSLPQSPTGERARSQFVSCCAADAAANAKYTPTGGTHRSTYLRARDRLELCCYRATGS